MCLSDHYEDLAVKMDRCILDTTKYRHCPYQMKMAIQREKKRRQLRQPLVLNPGPPGLALKYFLELRHVQFFGPVLFGISAELSFLPLKRDHLFFCRSHEAVVRRFD